MLQGLTSPVGEPVAGSTHGQDRASKAANVLPDLFTLPCGAVRIAERWG